jgi:hypothetical protein
MVICVLRVALVIISLFPHVLFACQSLDTRDIRDIWDIRDSGSLSKLIFSGDSPRSKPVTVEVGMTEADFCGAILAKSGAIILSAWLKQQVQHGLD